MSSLDDYERRHDEVTALHVRSGISIQHLAGKLEARRHMEETGVPAHVIERILSGIGMQRRRVPSTKWPGEDRRKRPVETV